MKSDHAQVRLLAAAAVPSPVALAGFVEAGTSPVAANCARVDARVLPIGAIDRDITFLTRANIGMSASSIEATTLALGSAHRAIVLVALVAVTGRVGFLAEAVCAIAGELAATSGGVEDEPRVAGAYAGVAARAVAAPFVAGGFALVFRILEDEEVVAGAAFWGYADLGGQRRVGN